MILRGLLAALVAGLFAACAAPQQGPAPLVTYAGRPVRLNTVWTASIEPRPAFEKSAEQFGGVAFDAASQTAVAALSSGRIVGLDGRTGEVRWSNDSEAPAGGLPVIADGIVYLGTHDGTFRALRAATGELLWSTSVTGSFNSTVTVTGDLLVSVVSGSSVVALRRATGELAWRHDRTVASSIALQSDATVTAAGDDLFAGYADGYLERLDRTGKSIWSVPLSRTADRFRDVDTAPLVLGDTVYAASYGGGLFAISRERGSVVWQQPLTGISQLARVEGRLVVVTGDAQVRWLSPDTGETETAFALEEAVADGLVVSSGYLMLSTSERGLYLLDSKAPWVHGRLDAGAGFSTPVTVSGSKLFALTDGGSILRVDLSLL